MDASSPSSAQRYPPPSRSRCSHLVAGRVYTRRPAGRRDLLVSQMLVNASWSSACRPTSGTPASSRSATSAFAAIAGYRWRSLGDRPALQGGSSSRRRRSGSRGSTSSPDGDRRGGGDRRDHRVRDRARPGRSRASAGAVAPTMITLALLFVVYQAARNFTDLTGGDRPVSRSYRVPRSEGRTWIYLALGLSILAAGCSARAGAGRLAQAAREDELAARPRASIRVLAPTDRVPDLGGPRRVGASLRVQLWAR